MTSPGLLPFVAKFLFPRLIGLGGCTIHSAIAHFLPPHPHLISLSLCFSDHPISRSPDYPRPLPPGFHPITPKFTQYTQESAEGCTLRSLQNPRIRGPRRTRFWHAGVEGYRGPRHARFSRGGVEYTQGSAEGRNPKTSKPGVKAGSQFLPLLCGTAPSAVLCSSTKLYSAVTNKIRN